MVQAEKKIQLPEEEQIKKLVTKAEIGPLEERTFATDLQLEMLREARDAGTLSQKTITTPIFLTPSQATRLDFDIEEGEFIRIEPSAVGEEATFSLVTPEGIMEPQPLALPEPQLFPLTEVPPVEALQSLFPERFEAGETPQMVFESLGVLVQQQPVELLEQLVAKGRTPEVELLINTYFDVQPGDIDRLFAEMPDAEARLFREALPLLITDRNKDAMLTYFFENPEALRRNLIGVGRNSSTVALVKSLYPEITDKGMSQYFNPRVPGTVEGVDPTALGALPTKTWLDKVKEVIEDPLQLIPFVASGAEIVELGRLMKTAKDLEDGKEVSEEDLLALKAYVARATMDTTWGFEVADVIAQIVPFAGEFIATGGIFSAGKTAAAKAGEQALKRIATRTGLRILEGRLAKFAAREVIPTIVGGTLRAPVAGVTRIPAATLEKQLQATLTGDEESVFESAVKAFGEQWVEVVSESTGGLFAPLAASIKGQLIKAGLFRAFIKANPGKSPNVLRRVFEKAGYNGVIGEMLEERVADVGHGILEPLGLSDQKFSIPSVRQLTVELAAFSVPGAAALAIQKTPALFEKLSPKVKKALADAVEEGRARPERGAVEIPGERPEGEAPLTEALITDAESIVAQAETVAPDNAQVKEMRRLVDEAKVQTGDTQRKTLIKIEAVEDEVREIAGVPKVGEPVVEVTIPKLISDPSGTVAQARPTADFFPEIKPTTKLPVETELRVTIKAVGERQTSFWAQVHSRGVRSNTYLRIDKESVLVGKETAEGTELAGELVFHGAIVREQLARQNVLLGELQVVKIKPQPPVTPEEVARPEPGAPEAGIQPSMIEGIPAEEVRPPGKGKILQVSMDDQLKLQQARQAAEEAPPEVKEAYNTQAEIEGLKVTHQMDPVAQKRVFIGKDKRGRDQYRGLDFFISLKEQSLPEYFTIKQAKMLNPALIVDLYTQPGTPQFNKVPRDVALDQMTKEFNMTPDEIADRVMGIRQENRRIKELEVTIKKQMVETPLPAVTALTTEEVTENWETVAQPKLTLKQAQALSGIMADYVISENTIAAFEAQRALWSRTRTGRGEDFKARMQDLIVVQGVGVEEAFRLASNETLAGKLPVVLTDFFEGMTTEMRSAFFTVVFHNKQLQEYPYEMASTITALTNALDGKPIPRKRGRGSILFPEGGSAWDRLNFVFGKQPKVLKAIEKMADERKPLRDTVEGIFHETGREPIPIDQEAADYLRGLQDIPQGYTTLVEPELGFPTYSNLKNPADLQFAQAELELGRQLVDGEITIDQFELARREARDKAYPLPPVTKYDPPIDKAFKIPPMFNFMEQSMFNRVLKQILMSPLDIGNFLRANKASFDQSFLRQSQLLLSGHPILAWQAHAAAWQSMFSQKHTEAEWELITRDPDFQIYEQIRVDTGHDPLRVPAFAAKKGTEQYRTSEEFGFTRQDVERAIPRFTAWLPHVRLSERGFSAGTNKGVWGTWKQKLAWSRRYSEKIASGDVVLKEGEAFDIIQEMTDEQSMLGDLIQRANLRIASGLAPAMNAFFFAARSKVGRLLLPKHLLGISVRNKKVRFNPRVMREAWKDFFLWTSYISGIMFLGDWLDLWELETDPRNAEVMSARIGKTRIDPWAGYRQFVVLYARLITGTGISSVTGAEYDVDPIRAQETFGRSSISPLASILLEFWTGRNFLGQVIDYDDSKYWLEKITPFAINDIWEAAKEDWRMGIAVTIPAVYGEGVQTYTGDWEENFTKLGLPKYIENTAYDLSEPYYDTADFWSDTAKQFKGVDPETLTPAKGFPPYIKAIAEARVSNEHLATLPSDTLVSLNADPNLDEPTFGQYYQMWRDRQALVAAGEEAEITIEGETFKGEDAVEAFDKDERTKNSHRGNFSQRQFSLLNEYWSITNEKKQVEFLEEHKSEIGVKPRDAFLRSHPKENAELAIWGQAKVLTKEAYDHFKTLAKKYDIPDNAVPELLLPPETSIDTHFDYEEMVSEGTHSSNEAKLLLLKDQIAADEAKVKSYVTWRNESGQPLQLPKEQVEYYQLKVDNSQNYDDLAEAQEADDEEDVEEIRARKVDGETFLDVERRVDAMGKGTREVPIDPELVNSYVSHMRIGDETSPNSAESKLNRYDNNELNDFLMNEDYWGKQKAQALDKNKFYLDNYLVPRWRIDVAYQEQDEDYNALQTMQKRQQYLLDNEDYRMDRRRREALTTTDIQTGKRFPLDQIENFVSYHEIDVKGKRQERFLVNNPTFADAMHNIVGIDIPRPEDVPAIQYDDIYDQWTDEFEQLEGFADNQSEHYIEIPEIGLTLDQTREKARDAIRFDDEGKYTEFGLDELRRNAYGKFVPETLVSNYVGYYTIIGEGKPDNYEDVNKTDLWYDDDWFLRENIEFYEQVYKGILENEKRDFSKVPSREIFSKYLEYLQIDARQAKLRDDFRWDNLDLDDWLVLKFDYTPVTEKRRRAAQTPREKLAESIEELERRLRERPEEEPAITFRP
ncbi:hypothetical protein LCGC14_0684670 [marine sediment metagenome]|uniref:Large polyvalent protein associated domain-containing protein n=1 Tax=marine sediment metagenome TaxID=412755 RepID=A0A0F9T8J0_9ZZZZ